MEGRDLSANSTLRMRGEERPCPAVAAELSPRSKAVRMRLSPARVNQATGTDLSEVSLQLHSQRMSLCPLCPAGPEAVRQQQPAMEVVLREVDRLHTQTKWQPHRPSGSLQMHPCAPTVRGEEACPRGACRLNTLLPAELLEWPRSRQQTLCQRCPQLTKGMNRREKNVPADRRSNREENAHTPKRKKKNSHLWEPENTNARASG